MFDSVSGKPLAGDQGSFVRLSLGMRVGELLFGPASNEITLVAWGQFPTIIDAGTGAQTRSLTIDPTDQIVRLAFSSVSGRNIRSVAALLSGRVDLYSEQALDHRLAEPIKFKGQVGIAGFSPDGRRLFTLSGPTYSFDTVRVWSLEIPPPILWVDSEIKDDELAPPWLVDLADAVTGRSSNLDDGMDAGRSLTLEDLARQYRTQNISGSYKRLWNRYFHSAKRENDSL